MASPQTFGFADGLNRYGYNSTKLIDRVELLSLRPMKANSSGSGWRFLVRATGSNSRFGKRWYRDLRHDWR